MSDRDVWIQVTEQTVLFERSCHYRRDERPRWSSKSFRCTTEPLCPWPELRFRREVRVDPDFFQEYRSRRPRWLDCDEEGFLGSGVPGIFKLYSLLHRINHDGKVPARIALETNQSAYRRVHEVTVTEWVARPETPIVDRVDRANSIDSGYDVVQTHVRGFEISCAGLQPLDQEILLDGARLGMPAVEYYKLGIEGFHSFDYCTYRLVLSPGDKFEFRDLIVARGDSPAAVEAALVPLGFSVEKFAWGWSFRNTRISLQLDLQDGLVAKFWLMGGGTGSFRQLDPDGPAVSIRGLRPGSIEADATDLLGPPDRVVEDEDVKVLVWGENRLTAADEIRAVSLECAVRGGRLVSVRGDQLEQGETVLLRGPTELRGEDSEKEINDILVVDLDHQREVARTAPNRVSYYTDLDLSIWWYPDGRRQFVLKQTELPSLGIDLDYP